MDSSNPPADVGSPAQENRMPTPVEEISFSTASAMHKSTARRLVMNALRQLKNPKGSTFADIKKFLSSKTESSDAENLKILKMAVADAVDRGVLAKEDGKYKIKEKPKKKQSENKSSIKRKSKSGSTNTKTKSKKPSTEKKAKKRSPSKKKKSSRKLRV